MDKNRSVLHLSEDWWAVLIAFGLILAAALGWLGERGVRIVF
jgi:hypothetical protein